MILLSKQLLLAFGFLFVVLFLEMFTDIDIYVQNFFYQADISQWLINPALHKDLNYIFYKGPKIFTAVIGGVLLIYLLSSIKWINLRAYNQPVLILLLSLILVPSIVASMKYFTNVYCPYQLNIYNGSFPFVRILENYPIDFVQIKSGRCFPAGHATVGFAYMSLFYCFHKLKYRILGLCFGCAMGIIVSLYQMYRGQHFLSHSLFSFIASFMVIMIINYLVQKIMNTKKI